MSGSIHNGNVPFKGLEGVFAPLQLIIILVYMFTALTYIAAGRSMTHNFIVHQAKGLIIQNTLTFLTHFVV